MGRFAHEAAAVDPATSTIYLTEDSFLFPSGLYRYLPPRDPHRGGHVVDGGTLQMLKVAGTPPGRPVRRRSRQRVPGRVGRHRRSRPRHDRAVQQRRHPARRRAGLRPGGGDLQPPGGRRVVGRAPVLHLDAGRRGRRSDRRRRLRRRRPRVTGAVAARCGRTTRPRRRWPACTSRRRRPRSTCPTTSPPAPTARSCSARTAAATTSCAVSRTEGELFTFARNADPAPGRPGVRRRHVQPRLRDPVREHPVRPELGPDRKGGYSIAIWGPWADGPFA